ncbi:tyrosine-type recombinase/integrase [Sediminitomix flava]|uniref:Phage integrase family protein n=1 Tax=Sediminitomix flava TaxID=379075 RepID=A0A315Z793_SEDFL|nr:phage integrase SAM-like domain-containing protein [Sediminitomix flava]PWJ38645.1 phage integrase family protein [Sediminitomix flava]
MEVKYYLKGTLDKAGFDRVYASINHPQYRTRFKSYPKGIKVRKADWDMEQQRVKGEVGKMINPKLDLIAEKVGELFEHTSSLNQKQLKDLIDSRVKNIEKSFLQHALTDFLKTKHTENRRKEYRRLLERLEKVAVGLGTHLGFEAIDLTFLDTFKASFDSLNQSPETKKKYLKNLKSFLKWSYDRNYHSNDLFKMGEEFKVRSVNESVGHYLKLDEIIKIMELELTDSDLVFYRNLLLLTIFTGQRISDILHVSKADLHFDTWDFISQKTGNRMIVPLKDGFGKLAAQIFNEFDYSIPKVHSKKGSANFISEKSLLVKLNIAIKKICKMAGLYREIKVKRRGVDDLMTMPLYSVVSSKWGRKTFITHHKVQSVDADVLTWIVGHEDKNRRKDVYDGRGVEEVIEEIKNKMSTVVSELETFMKINTTVHERKVSSSKGLGGKESSVRTKANLELLKQMSEEMKPVEQFVNSFALIHQRVENRFAS